MRARGFGGLLIHLDLIISLLNVRETSRGQFVGGGLEAILTDGGLCNLASAAHY